MPSGSFAGSIQAHADAVRLSMEQPLFWAAQGHACGRAGMEREAHSAIELLKLSTLRYVSPLEIAVIYIGLDDTGAAFDWLQKACVQRVTRMSALRDPIFDRLRCDLQYNGLGLARRMASGRPVFTFVRESDRRSRFRTPLVPRSSADDWSAA